ncbi:uncharacterized protein N7469_009536 [Penicillium citrinum]|uniref:Uncharacterized protein n=1 Tax=Penicillium citrinum TaxID=5077 RepID=A0A9W9NIL1_PENCI|nr:uncharacterized protein N7469_009536 [Penicillium citrinum]KAJ5220649.1 hypothetical protein N7469_009536 [Penicillium citrinum]
MPDKSFTCEFAGCVLPSICDPGPCGRCNQQSRFTYFSSPFHTYLEIGKIRSIINDSEVCKRASELNGGLKREIGHPPHEDAERSWAAPTIMLHRWHCLAYSVNGSIPQSIIDYLICSEYATLKFLETTKVPAPRAFDYGIAEDENNKVGVSYIFLEEMAGRAWNSQGPHGKRSADGKDKERDWNGLDDILIELKRHPFPKAVSLLPGSSPSKPIVSAVASERFLVLGPSGPFSTAKDYYTSFVEHNMALIADRQLFTIISSEYLFGVSILEVPDTGPYINFKSRP